MASRSTLRAAMRDSNRRSAARREHRLHVRVAQQTRAAGSRKPSSPPAIRAHRAMRCAAVFGRASAASVVAGATGSRKWTSRRAAGRRAGAGNFAGNFLSAERHAQILVLPSRRSAARPAAPARPHPSAAWKMRAWKVRDAIAGSGAAFGKHADRPALAQAFDHPRMHGAPANRCCRAVVDRAGPRGQPADQRPARDFALGDEARPRAGCASVRCPATKRGWRRTTPRRATARRRDECGIRSSAPAFRPPAVAQHAPERSPRFACASRAGLNTASASGNAMRRATAATARATR